MEITKGFIRSTLEDLKQSLDAILDGLDQKEIEWKPSPALNSIGLIVFHTARSEDFFMRELVMNQPQVWEKDKWYEKYKFPVEERGRHYNEDQVKAFVSPEISLLRDYFTSVRSHTYEYITTLTEEEYSRVVVTPRGERPVSGFLTNIINHSAQHAGEISYLRGLQRGLNK